MSVQSLKIYIDGTEITPTKNVDVDWTDFTLNYANNIYVGASANSINGSIDEVRIYNRALSADEIRNLYEQRDEIHDPFVYKTV